VSADSNSNANRDSVSRPAETPGRGQWLKNNLVGIGSAAVLAVYAAGFERTRAAAARFNEEAAGRRSATPIQPTGEIGGLKPRVAEQVATPPVQSASPVQASSSAPAKTTAATKSPPVKTKPTLVDTAAAVTTEKHPADAPPAVVVTAVPTPEPVRDSTPAPPKPAATAAPADTAQAEKIARKDGTYTGWGTSRHGDIQATVQIKDGKIAFAAISECLTRYSCSWIAALPPQVLARQSADVDVVSGATESTNAFYYAVIEALNKAK
jgi:uncharacterized protein with FMN-binding domain